MVSYRQGSQTPEPATSKVDEQDCCKMPGSVKGHDRLQGIRGTKGFCGNSDPDRCHHPHRPAGPRKAGKAISMVCPHWVAKSVCCTGRQGRQAGWMYSERKLSTGCTSEGRAGAVLEWGCRKQNPSFSENYKLKLMGWALLHTGFTPCLGSSGFLRLGRS